MPVTHVHSVHVEFGDCDPAQIAYFPNYFRWFDASTFNFFRQCGLPAWGELEKTHGLIGFPVVDVSCTFLRPVTVGDRLEVHTTLEEWRDKSFVMKHELRRADLPLLPQRATTGETVAQGREIRVFAKRDPVDPSRIKAVPVPEIIRQNTR